MTFFCRPPWNFDWWYAEKNQPSSTSERACAPDSHSAYMGFWPILAKMCFSFCEGKFVPVRGNLFLWGEILAKFRDQSAMLGESLSQKFALAHTSNPEIWPKKQPKFLWQFLSKGRLNLWAKKSEPKNRSPTSFLLLERVWSSNLCAAKFPHYNYDPVNSLS